MKSILLSFTKLNKQLITRKLFFFVIFALFGSLAYSQIATTTPASRCGEGTLVLQATATSGTIKWYSVPFYGTAIATGTTFTTPSLIVSTTYYVDAVDGTDCSLNPGKARVPVIASIGANSVQASIFYPSTAFCRSLNVSQLPTRTGTPSGTYSSVGLTIDPLTGAFVPSANNAGTYDIYYTPVAAQGCVENPAFTQVTLTTAPQESEISYTGSPFCTSAAPVGVNLLNDNNGTFTASPSGLHLNATTGQITPSLSFPGTYIVTYAVAGSGGCAPQNKITQVTIVGVPTAVVSYAGAPFCKDVATAQTPQLTGTGAYVGGTFSYNGAGTLNSFNTSTGSFIPSASTAGNYTVYYDIQASGNCSAVQVSTSLVVNELPAASVAGSVTVCENAAEPNVTFSGTAGTAPFTFTYNVNGGGSQMITTTSGNSVNVAQATTAPGTFTYNLLSVSDANGCTQAAGGSATIQVTATPVATFLYPNTSYCKVGTATPTFTGGATAGTFISIPAGVVFGAGGVIDLASTPVGDYIVRNTINICGSVSHDRNISITALPTAVITGSLVACVSTTLTATTNVNPLNAQYTWYKDDAVIAGQTLPTLVASASGSYKVKVTNGLTGCDITSASSVVSISALPTASITGALSGCPSVNLTAQTNAASPSYTWYQQSTVDPTIWEEILGATDPTYVATTTTGYKVKITTAGTGCENTSDAFEVSISRPTVAGTVNGGQTVCIGSNSTELTLSSDYVGAILRWESSVAPFNVWTPIANTTASYTATGLTQTTQFRAVVQSCLEANSVAATVTVVADPSLTQPVNVSICKGGSTILTTVASNGTGTYNYQWQYATTSNGTYANVADGTPAGVTYTGATSASLVVTGDGSEAAQANYYKCIVTQGSGCDAVTLPITVTSVVDPSWIAFLAPNNQIVVGNSVSFSVSISGGLGGIITWTRSTTPNGAGVQVFSPDTPPAAGTYYYRPQFSANGSGCTLGDGTETMVTVSPLAPTGAASQSFCSSN